MGSQLQARGRKDEGRGEEKAERARAEGGERTFREKALAERERAIAALATRQHGVVSRRQLLDAGQTPRMIQRRVEAGRFHLLHRGVYAVGHERLSRRSHWLAAVFASGPGALLSHRSAAYLWGLMRPRGGPIDVSARSGRVNRGDRGSYAIHIHEGRLAEADRAEVAAIPVTSVARTLFDLAEAVDERSLERAFEEADRLRLLRMRELEEVCSRGHGRRALRPIRRLIEEAMEPETVRSPLEERVLDLCRKFDLPRPLTNLEVLDHEVDAYWPEQRLMVEADSYAYHHHRAAFEEDRARDAAMQAAGYRVIRLTHRRLEREPAAVAAQLRRLLSIDGRSSSSLAAPEARGG